MRRRTIRARTLLLPVVLALTCSIALGACRKKGPAEEAGEKIDETVEKVGDAINPKGPAEKAGRAIDKAVDDATD